MRSCIILVTLSAVFLGCGQPSETIMPLTAPGSAAAPDNGQVIIGGQAATPVAFNVEGLPTVTFDVPEMHCAVMCVPKVRETLAQQPGVKDVQVDLDSKTAVVAVDQAAFDADGAVAALVAAEFADSAIAESPAN